MVAGDSVGGEVQGPDGGLGRVGHDPVTAVALGAIERLIRTLQNELGRIVGEFERGHTHAGRDFERADPLPGVKRRCRDALAQPLAREIGLGEVGIRHDHDEFLAAQPASEVDPADIAAYSRRDSLSTESPASWP